MNPNNCKKDAKKKKLMGMDSENEVERILDLDENIVCTSMYMEVNLTIFHHKEDKEVTKLFHIKIQVKNTKVDSLFEFCSQAKLVADDLLSQLGLEVHDHPNSYPLG
jgi:hypothetical protein